MVDTRARLGGRAGARVEDCVAPPWLDRISTAYPRLTPWATILSRLRRLRLLRPPQLANGAQTPSTNWSAGVPPALWRADGTSALGCRTGVRRYNLGRQCRVKLNCGRFVGIESPRHGVKYLLAPTLTLPSPSR